MACALQPGTAFWAAGVAASPAAKWLGQAGDKSGRVVVDGNLAVHGCAGVFAIGDTAASDGWAGAGVPGVGPRGKAAGTHVANVIRAAIKGHPSPHAFLYRHYGNLATIGRLAAVVELRWLRLWGAPAWWALGTCPRAAPDGRPQPRHRRAELALGLLHLQAWNPVDHWKHDGYLSHRPDGPRGDPV